MWSKILGFVLDKDNRSFILLGLLVASIVFGVTQCDAKQEAKQEVQKQKNNISALKDSVGYYENKAGDLTAEKLSLQTDINQLETLNQDLYEQVQNERDKVDQITKINAELRADTVDTDTTYTSRVGIGAWRFNWELEKSGEGWHKVLEGYTHFKIDSTGIPYGSNTVVTKDQLLMTLVTGITSKNGQKRIFVRSSYPNLTVTNIQGAILEDSPILEKPSRFGIGVHLGQGFAPKVGLTPVISVGLNFNLIRW